MGRFDGTDEVGARDTPFLLDGDEVEEIIVEFLFTHSDRFHRTHFEWGAKRGRTAQIDVRRCLGAPGHIVAPAAQVGIREKVRGAGRTLPRH